jgi:hypothetical protein
MPIIPVAELAAHFCLPTARRRVSAEDREALLGHASHTMAGHYASADVGRLIKQSESHAKPRSHMECPAHRERTSATAVDKRSGKGPAGIETPHLQVVTP